MIIAAHCSRHTIRVHEELRESTALVAPHVPMKSSRISQAIKHFVSSYPLELLPQLNFAVNHGKEIATRELNGASCVNSRGLHENYLHLCRKPCRPRRHRREKYQLRAYRQSVRHATGIALRNDIASLISTVGVLSTVLVICKDHRRPCYPPLPTSFCTQSASESLWGGTDPGKDRVLCRLEHNTNRRSNL